VIRPSVSIIGSFRQHYKLVEEAAHVFAVAGMTVKSPPIARITNPGREFVRFASDPPLSLDHHIQAATLENLFSSDFVYVVNPGGYIGRTTAYELGRILERGMAVYFAERPQDLPIEIPGNIVLSPSALAAAIGGGDLRVEAIRRPRVAALPTADLVILTIREQRLCVLLIKRGKEPYLGRLALPGGFVRPGESLEDTARRELAEETGLDGTRLPLQQVHTYSAPNRDPRGRIVTTAFLAIAPDLPEAVAGTDANRADWIEVEDSLTDRLAFDHGKILSQTLERARRLLEYTTIAAAFCHEEFTVSDLRMVYEAIWGVELNSQNFHRKVTRTEGFLVDARRLRTDRPGRPAELYRRGPAQILYPPMLRPVQYNGTKTSTSRS
jgi:ADP-ribose pyrophosphatase YjhB (NUDIX family)